MVAGAAGPRRMARVMGLISVPITLGPVVGPIIGGLILQNLSWQWMFLVNIPFAIAAIILALVVLPADPRGSGRPAPLDWLGVFLLCPGFAAIVYALSRAGGDGFGSGGVIAGLAVGLLLFACYIAHALRTAGTPLLDVRLFRAKGFTASMTTMFLIGGGLRAHRRLVRRRLLVAVRRGDRGVRRRAGRPQPPAAAPVAAPSEPVAGDYQ
ncbi:MFS transporter [Sphaerisporangium dianthi]|uniref:MFS transporter n=1 Tax=Sphaerisporangium dianthi TaxID=1436120 RepID=A0ABV9CQ30_9ACTN